MHDRAKFHKIKVDTTSKEYTPNRFKKEIIQYSSDGDFIKKWIGIVDAVKECGFPLSGKKKICECAKGIRKSYKGFVWKYVAEG